MLLKSKLTASSGIYLILSKRSGKIYVGSTVNFLVRKNIHFATLSKGNHHNFHLQNHCNKYSIIDLEFLIIEFCSLKDLISREQYYINILNPDFNICKVAGSSLNRKHSKSSILKMKKAKQHLTGNPVSQFTKEGIFVAKYKSRKEASKKVGISISGITYCVTKKFKTAGDFIWTHGHPPTQKELQVVNKMKTNKIVSQYDLDGNHIATYHGIKYAAIETGINHREIRSCLKGRQKSTHSFTFKLIN